MQTKWPLTCPCSTTFWRRLLQRSLRKAPATAEWDVTKRSEVILLTDLGVLSELTETAELKPPSDEELLSEDPSNIGLWLFNDVRRTSFARRFWSWARIFFWLFAIWLVGLSHDMDPFEHEYEPGDRLRLRWDASEDTAPKPSEDGD